MSVLLGLTQEELDVALYAFKYTKEHNIKADAMGLEGHTFTLGDNLNNLIAYCRNHLTSP